MSKVASLKVPRVREQVGDEEWAVRVDLAACYRLVARFGWEDLIFTHNSARVPGAEDHFLLNPFGLAFDEITASNLLKVDVDGNLVMDSPYEYLDAGFVIHSAIHMARPDLKCVMHTHTTAGMAVAAQADGLLPVNQKAMPFYNRIGYHDYEGVADDLDERRRLAANLGDNKAMILRNHGLLVAGESVAEAFLIMHTLQGACETQIAAQAGGKLHLPPPEVCEHAAKQSENFRGAVGGKTWPALLRMLDRADPSYAE